MKRRAPDRARSPVRPRPEWLEDRLQPADLHPVALSAAAAPPPAALDLVVADAPRPQPIANPLVAAVIHREGRGLPAAVDWARYFGIRGAVWTGVALDPTGPTNLETGYAPDPADPMKTDAILADLSPDGTG